MMLASLNFGIRVESELRDAGCDCVRAGDGLSVPSLALEVRALSPTLKPLGSGFAMSVVFEASGNGALSNRWIQILSIGFGDTDTAAAPEAISQWRLGVFPALRSYIMRPDHFCEVTKAHMTVETDAGERFGWTAHIGQALWRLYSSNDSECNELAPEIDESEIYRAMLEAVRPVAVHNTLFWLERFAARYPDGHVEATCRYNNVDWPAGQQALLDWAAKWPQPTGRLLSRR
ncbi:MAG: DUF6348 family protein [Blastocatellia bacterium]